MPLENENGERDTSWSEVSLIQGRFNVNKYNHDFKKQVVLDVLRGESTLVEIAEGFHVSVSVIKCWEREALQGFSLVFQGKTLNPTEDLQKKIERLERKVWQLTMDNDFLKKSCEILHLEES